MMWIPIAVEFSGREKLGYKMTGCVIPLLGSGQVSISAAMQHNELDLVRRLV